MSTKLLSLFTLCLSFVNIAIGSDDQDPFDLSFYTKGAAIGDSYAAGIGAGNEVHWSCSRYDGSYASLVALQLGVDIEDLDFTYTACSGALVEDVYEQAEKLSSGQEFITVSAGGNDAQLTDILNSCVFSFYGGLSHPSCDKQLDEGMDIIKSEDFASKLDSLLDVVKSKLSPDGNVYYTGYAKFFDTSDTTCDKVSWHVWLNLYTREYLTLQRRKMMNTLVDEMNKALKSAVQRAGSKVHFIEYDDEVGATRGRYCQAGQDESGGKGANVKGLFFYQMKSRGTPMFDTVPYHDELKRRQISGDEDVKPANGTLSAVYGAMMQQAIIDHAEDDDDAYAALEDNNANLDLQEEVDDEVDEVKDEFEKRTPFHLSPRYEGFVASKRSPHSWNTTLIDSAAPNPPLQAQRDRELGSKVTFPDKTFPASIIDQGAHMRFSNFSVTTANPTASSNDTTANNTSSGTIVANSTHVLLHGGKPVQRQAFNFMKLILSDMTARVFHPTQNGHALIANHVLWEMARDNAKRLGLDNEMLSEYAASTGEGWPTLPGAACNKDSSDTWTDRDAMRSAVTEFCSDVNNVHGSKGDVTSGTFNSGLDYMNVSIEWDSDDSVISQHSCMSWLDVTTDGGSNYKHGGTIDSNYNSVNATLRVEPLVMRQIWDGWQDGGQQCNGIDTQNYLDQATLSSNIEEFCTEFGKQDIAESGSIFSQTYNDGTPDRVDLTVEWPKGPRNFQVFQEECTWYMGVLNNGCSLPGDDNKMNWKHGGSISDFNDIKYTIQPTKDRPPPPEAPFGSCHSKWVPTHYKVSVWGAGSLNSDWGGALLKEFRKCGATTAWTFKYYDTPAEDGTEWEAYGQIPITIPFHCGGRAVSRAAQFGSKRQC